MSSPSQAEQQAIDRSPTPKELILRPFPDIINKLPEDEIDGYEDFCKFWHDFDAQDEIGELMEHFHMIKLDKLVGIKEGNDSGKNTEKEMLRDYLDEKRRKTLEDQDEVPLSAEYMQIWKELNKNKVNAFMVELAQAMFEGFKGTLGDNETSRKEWRDAVFQALRAEECDGPEHWEEIWPLDDWLKGKPVYADELARRASA